MKDEMEGKAQDEGVASEQAEYDAAWDDGEGANKQENTSADDQAALDETGLPDDKQAPADDNKDDVKSEKYGTVKSMEKALDDTKTYAHRLEQEKAELLRKVEELKKGGASPKEVADAQEAVKAAQDDLDAVKQKVYEDYPELQALIDPLLERNKALESKLVSFETVRMQEAEKAQKNTLIENFNLHVKPQIVSVHSDFDSIVQSEGYWQWAEKQRPSLRTAAMDSPDPTDIIWAVTEYKKANAAAQIPGVKTKEAAERESRLRNSQVLRGGGTPSFPSRDKESDSKEYAWDAAGELLKRQGIGT